MMRRSALLIGLLFLSVTIARGAEGSSGKKSGTPASATHLVSLALVVAGNESAGGGVQPLSAPVAKAIGDIKDFLPYKSYEVHDTVVLRTASLNPARFDLQGPDGRYVARFLYRIGEDNRLRFDQFEMARLGSDVPATAPQPTPEGRQPETPWPSPTRQVLSTSFSVEVGETIVVGTSRLNHTGKALVVVLTVLPVP